MLFLPRVSQETQREQVSALLGSHVRPLVARAASVFLAHDRTGRTRALQLARPAESPVARACGELIKQAVRIRDLMDRARAPPPLAHPAQLAAAPYRAHTRITCGRHRTSTLLLCKPVFSHRTPSHVFHLLRGGG